MTPLTTDDVSNTFTPAVNITKLYLSMYGTMQYAASLTTLLHKSLPKSCHA